MAGRPGLSAAARPADKDDVRPADACAIMSFMSVFGPGSGVKFHGKSSSLNCGYLEGFSGGGGAATRCCVRMIRRPSAEG